MRKRSISIPYFLLTSFLLITASNIFTQIAYAINLDIFGGSAALLIVSFLAGFFLPNARPSFRDQKSFALYLPVFVPFFIELLIQVFGSSADGILLLALFFLFNQTLLAFTGKGLWFAVNLAAVCCFGIGERLSSRRKNVPRKLPAVQFFIAMIALFAAFWGIGKYHSYRKDLSTPAYHVVWGDSSEKDEDSYHFPFERGWSSTDLRPYYVENPDNLLAKLDEKASFTISEYERMPVLDGAEAAYPVYSAFAYACYKDIAEIQREAKENGRYQDAPIQFTNTIEA